MDNLKCKHLKSSLNKRKKKPIPHGQPRQRHQKPFKLSQRKCLQTSCRYIRFPGDAIEHNRLQVDDDYTTFIFLFLCFSKSDPRSSSRARKNFIASATVYSLAIISRVEDEQRDVHMGEMIPLFPLTVLHNYLWTK